MNSFFFDSDPFGSSSGAVDNEEYYETLGVAKDATQKELRKAYLRLSLKHHPDKGGDVEEFKKITEAYETLSDEQKRKNYDKFGKKGGSDSAYSGGSPNDIFSSFFGGMGGMGGMGGRRGKRGEQEDRGLRKEKSVTHPIRVTLEELYVGKTVTLNITRKIIASVVNPRQPVPTEKLHEVFSLCSACQGRGMRVEQRQLAPGMVQQMSMPCRQCNRTGRGIKEGYLETTAEEKVVVEIEKGMAHNSKIVKAGLGDMHAGTLPGDLVFVVAQQEHALYKRKGHDLLMKKEISLTQALCGLRFALVKLDGSTARIDNFSGRGAGCIKPNGIMVIEDLGMPKPGTLEFGRLFVNFTVVFPSAPLSPAVQDKLRAVLPRTPRLDGDPNVTTATTTTTTTTSRSRRKNDQGECHETPKGPKHQDGDRDRDRPRPVGDDDDDDYQETYTLEHVDPNTFGHMDAHERSAYDSDEDGGYGGQQQQCRQM